MSLWCEMMEESALMGYFLVLKLTLGWQIDDTHFCNTI